MSQHTTDERSEDESEIASRTGELVAHVETYDDAPDECTIYPSDATPDELLTRWITARAWSFIDLADAR